MLTREAQLARRHVVVLGIVALNLAAMLWLAMRTPDIDLAVTGAAHRPLVVTNGKVTQMPGGDSLSLGSDAFSAGSASTSTLNVTGVTQFGTVTIPTADVAITDGHPTSQAQLWIQNDDIHHVGTGGNNEQIGIVIRNNATFDTTATTANSTGIDVIVSGGVDTGGNVLTATALAPNATCVSCNGGVAYAINSQFGTVKVGGPVDFGGSPSVGLGTGVQNFELPGSTTTVARIGIGALPSVDGTGVQVKNTVTTSTLSGYEVGLDTTVNSGIRGGYLMSRGTGGNFGGNTAGMVTAGGAGFPFTTSAAGEMVLYSELGQAIVLGADDAGFTSALRITKSNHLVQDTSTGLPTLNASCTSGTGSSIVGNDNKFEVTMGTTSTSCTITFKKTWTLKPICNITTEGGAALPTYTVSATAITITVNVNSGVYNVDCQGQPGSS